MDVASIISLRRNLPLRDFVLFGSAVVLWLAVDLSIALFDPRAPLRLITTYALPFIAAVGLILLFRLWRQRSSNPRSLAEAGGLVFVVGAAATDLLSTVLINPDLTLEANPYIRILLDSGHSLRFVYVHMAITQATYIAMFCGLWITFLRHLPVLMETIADAHPRGPIEFLKAATGGSHLTTRQWLIPLRTSELPLLYHCLWPLVVSIVFGISLFRWYAALEWMDVVEPTLGARAAVVAFGLTAALMAYFQALWRIYDQRLAKPSDAEALTTPY